MINSNSYLCTAAVCYEEQSDMIDDAALPRLWQNMDLNPPAETQRKEKSYCREEAGLQITVVQEFALCNVSTQRSDEPHFRGQPSDAPRSRLSAAANGQLADVPPD
jgi:hypothetical protein